MDKGCPKCKGMFIPNFVDGKLINQCCSCGYIQNIDDSDVGLKVGNERLLKDTFVNEFNATRQSIIDNQDKLIVISYLKAIREKKKISQKQIADILGCAEQRYGTVERHNSAPSGVLIAQIAYILNVSAGDVYKTVKVSKKMYDKLRILKIEKLTEKNFSLVESQELKDLINQIESISDKTSVDYKLLKKQYDKQVSSLFLKQGELVESIYWEKYLEQMSEQEIKENIKTL